VAEAPPAAWEELVGSESGVPGVSEGTMFGAPCLKIGSKVYVSLIEGAAVFKLPRERVEELLAESAADPFTPMGRAMKEWLVIPDTARWPAFAEEARRFVSG
jgi:hypothetical protein